MSVSSFDADGTANFQHAPVTVIMSHSCFPPRSLPAFFTWLNPQSEVPFCLSGFLSSQRSSEASSASDVDFK